MKSSERQSKSSTVVAIRSAGEVVLVAAGPKSRTREAMATAKVVSSRQQHTGRSLKPVCWGTSACSYVPRPSPTYRRFSTRS